MIDRSKFNSSIGWFQSVSWKNFADGFKFGFEFLWIYSERRYLLQNNEEIKDAKINGERIIKAYLFIYLFIIVLNSIMVS